MFKSLFKYLSCSIYSRTFGGRCGHDRMNLDFQLPMPSVPVTTKAKNSNPAHADVYSIQHYVIKFVSDL